MQDNKALQAGTSHNLGQNFAKAFDVTFQTAEGGLDHVWSTSWGVSTRLVGGLIMTHGDDNGLICPPRLAQWQVVIVPIWKTDEELARVLEAADLIARGLRAAGIRTHVDQRQGMKPGAKYYEWEGRGVPLRLELGPRDLANQTVMLARRTGGPKESVPTGGLAERLLEEMDQMQAALFEAAKARREAASLRGPKSKQEFIDFLEGTGGFVYAGWCGDPAVEAEIKEQTKATIRVMPDEEFRSPAPDHDLHLDRAARGGRSGLGQGLLMTIAGHIGPRPGVEGRQGRLFADAGLTRAETARCCLAASPVETIARSAGTPAYAYNAEAIRRRYGALTGALAPLPHQIQYAVKANACLAVLRVLRDLGAGCDIVSEGELRRALAAGFAPERIVFSGVGKTPAELTVACRRRHRADQHRIARGAGGAGSHRRGGGAPRHGRDPGQSRCHRGHPPLHHHRHGGGQVRDSRRSGGRGGTADRGAPSHGAVRHRDARGQPAARPGAVREGRPDPGRPGRLDSPCRHPHPALDRSGWRARHSIQR